MRTCALSYQNKGPPTVNWLFSFEENDVVDYVPQGQSAFRKITIDSEEIDFSTVAEDLHTESYKKIIANNLNIYSKSMKKELEII